MGFMRLTNFSSRETGSSRENYDRFIPNRSAMDFDMANYLLVESWKEKERSSVGMSPSSRAYQMLLKEILMKNTERILAFKNKSSPPGSSEGIFGDIITNFAKQQRHIPQTPVRTLDAPGLMDDYYLNLLDWGSSNVVSIALGSTLYLRDVSGGSTAELMTVDEGDGPITSVRWAPDGRHLALGLYSSDIQLWDVDSGHLVRTLKGAHQYGVGSLDWNNNSILTSGGMEGIIADNDVRIGSHIVQTYRGGHQQEVCCLKWSGSGDQLASRGNDTLLHIWERNRSRWVHRFVDHNPAVKALAWCPFRNGLLASGGSRNESCISFWDTSAGSCLNSVDTGSRVCNLVWNKNEQELLSSHGSSQNQLTLWKYPSLDKLAELTSRHPSQFLYMAQSPDGCSIASAGNEVLEFWNVFPEAPKMANGGPLTSFSHIR